MSETIDRLADALVELQNVPGVIDRESPEYRLDGYRIKAAWLLRRAGITTLDDYQGEIGGWGEMTFPKGTRETVIAHFDEEVGELLREYHQPRDTAIETLAEEAADCLLLLLHFAHKCGFSLFDAAERKMAINRARTWTNDVGTHVKHSEAIA